MGKINIVNDSDGRLTVELDGKALSPQEIFNSSDSNTNITDDANFWDLQTLGEQYDLTLEDIMAAVENYADTKNADIGYSVDELPNSVEPEAGAMSTFYENNKGRTTMNITKGRLKQIIQEELSRVEEKSIFGTDVAHFDSETGAPLTAKGWEIAAKNPKHRFHKQAREKLSKDGFNNPDTEQDWKNRRIAFRDTTKTFQALQKILISADKLDLTGAYELQNKVEDLFATFLDVYAPRWKGDVEEGRGIRRHEPEEKLITVTEEELIEARHAAYYLIKSSLESGADSVSLEGTVRDVYGYNVPSHILELFSDEE